eukprot:UN00813
MHPALSCFSRMEFYEGILKDGIGPQHRKLPEGYDWPHAFCPVDFINCEGREEESPSKSFQNTVEAQLVIT